MPIVWPIWKHCRPGGAQVPDYAIYSGPSQAVAMAALGHPLPPGAVIHHVNGDHLDNRNRNMVICQDQAYHMLLHSRTAWRRTLKKINDYLDEGLDDNPHARATWLNRD